MAASTPDKPVVAIRNALVHQAVDGSFILVGTIEAEQPYVQRSSRLLRIDFEAKTAETIDTLYKLGSDYD